MKKLFIQSAILVFFYVISSLSTNAQQKIAAFKDDNGLWGYINVKGEIVVAPKYSQVKAFSPDGIALVKEKKSKEYAYINTSGTNLQLDCNPKKYGNFSDGMAMVRIGDLWGYIDTNGKLVIQAKYSKAGNFAMGKAIVVTNSDKVLLIDKSGNETDLSAFNITNFKDFTEGMARVQISSGSWGFINTDGKMAIEANYMKVGDFSAGLAWVRVGDDQIGFIDKSNKMIIDPVYLAVKDFDPISGVARAKNKSGDWIFVNKEGTEFSIDASRLSDFSEGLCSVDKNSNSGVFGFIDNNGKWVIEPKFEATGDFKQGVCTVRVDKMWGLIDKEGNVLIEPKYSGLHDFSLVK